MTVLIENDNFERIIKRCESGETVFYCDPPYLGKEGIYNEGGYLTLDDHLMLASRLNETESRDAICYYAHPRVYFCYPASIPTPQ